MTERNPSSKKTSRQTCLAKALLLWVGILTGSFQLPAQGWEIYFGGNSEDFGHAIIQTKDHGYLGVGFSESFGPDGDMDVYVIRTDVDGKEIWSNYFDDGFVEHGYGVIETTDNSFLVVGDILPNQVTKANVYLLKVDDKGQKIWSKQYGGAEIDLGYRIIPTANSGGYLIVGKTASMGNGQDDVFLVKIDAQGNQIWAKAYGTSGNDFGRSVIEMPDGYLVTGSAFNSDNNSTDLYLLKVDFAGNQVWQKFFGTNDIEEGFDLLTMDDGNIALLGYAGSVSDVYLLKVTPDGQLIWSKTFGGALGDQGFDMLKAKNGDLVIAGVTEIDPTNADAFLLQVDGSGNKLWSENIGRGSHVDWGQAVAQTQDGGFIVIGYNSLIGAFVNDVTFIKTGPTGAVYTNHLTGKVFIDDNDCILETGEQGLNDWIIRASSPGKTFFGTTDSNGQFDITIDTGHYTVSVLTKNSYWNACVAAYNVNITAMYDTLVRNFPMLPLTGCPLLEVDVSTPSVQNCANIGYVVNFGNTGTQAAANPSVEIVLDNKLTLTGSSIPVVFQQDSLYVFNLPALGLNETGSFYFTASSDCNGVEGQAYTVKAHILPDTVCSPVSPFWDQASIDVDGYCDTDSIRFNIRNEGSGDMQAPKNFIVIEDHIMLAQPMPFQLEAGGETSFALRATGATYRLIAEQSQGHPGDNYPTVAVEGCTTTGGFSTGFVTELQENENDPFVSIDVQESISSTDYILLRGYPKGYERDGQNVIPANTDIQYHIFFQNAGTDTITRLTIRDTLPASLDIGSVAPGSSSHAYEFEVYNNGVLKFNFDNIHLLPDGSAASQGFVQFKVSQKPNNPVGTEIPNSAAVSLGFDAPVRTSTYTHVVGGANLLNFIEVLTDTKEPKIPGVTINAFPNPFASAIEFEAKGATFKNLTLSVFDMSGQLVRREKATGNRLRFTRGSLAAGPYAYRLEADGRLLDTGKLIVR